MSKMVEIPHNREFRFPPQCVCCLQEAAEWRDTRVVTYPKRISSMGGTRYIETNIEFEVPQIPYCRGHARELDAHLAWQRTSKEHYAKIPEWLMRLIILGPLILFGIIAAVIWKTFIAFFVGLMVGFIPVAIIATIMDRRAKRAIEQRLSEEGQPLRTKGDQFKFHPSVFEGYKLGIGGTLGLDIGGRARVEDQGQHAIVKIEAILLDFQNPQYASLFQEANGL